MLLNQTSTIASSTQPRDGLLTARDRWMNSHYYSRYYDEGMIDHCCRRVFARRHDFEFFTGQKPRSLISVTSAQ